MAKTKRETMREEEGARGEEKKIINKRILKISLNKTDLN
jgi:hypothetical protein